MRKHLYLWGQPTAPIGPLGQRSHLSPVTPSLQLQRPVLSHDLLTEPEEKQARAEQLK